MAIDMKMVPNAQTDFERTLINIQYVTSRMIDFYKY